MLAPNHLFPEADCRAIMDFFATRDRCRDLGNFRTLPPQPVDTIFYGDSIVEAWPLHEFFPGRSLLNRGIGGDNVTGLYLRLDEDIYPYTPRRVAIHIGINGIERPNDELAGKITAIGRMIAEHGSDVILCTVEPLRSPDAWDRFQYQGKIVELNQQLAEIAKQEFSDFWDFHSILKDSTGQLAAEYAREDGTHMQFAAYRAMSGLVAERLNWR